MTAKKAEAQAEVVVEAIEEAAEEAAVLQEELVEKKPKKAASKEDPLTPTDEEVARGITLANKYEAAGLQYELGA